MATQDFTFPNGIITAYYGTAASCEKCVLDAMDYKAATGPLAPAAEAAKWSLNAQSGTIVDRTPQRFSARPGQHRDHRHMMAITAMADAPRKPSPMTVILANRHNARLGAPPIRYPKGPTQTLDGKPVGFDRMSGAYKLAWFRQRDRMK